MSNKLTIEIHAPKETVAYKSRRIELKDNEGNLIFHSLISPYPSCCGSYIMHDFYTRHGDVAKELCKKNIMEILDKFREAGDRTNGGGTCIIAMDQENGDGSRFFREILEIPEADAYVNYNTGNNISTFIIKV